MTYTTKDFVDTVQSTYFAGDYSGVTHAGLLVVARDSGAMLLAQRAMDETDAPEVQETWEMPGGSLEPGEDPFAGAIREFTEEVGTALPSHEVVHGWRAGPEDNYQGFVVAVDEQFAVDPSTADPTEVQNVLWATPEEAATLNLRPEFAKVDLAALVATVSGNQGETMSEVPVEAEPVIEEDTEMEEPALTWADIAVDGIPIHGVMAPENVETGDGRGFNEGSMTSRPGRLPFAWQKVSINGHDGSVVVGGLDRLMRKDGLIHYEGTLMPSEEASEFAGLLAFMGRFGVSVDGDKGSLDTAKSEASGVMWFEAVRSAGLTAVAIPAFHEAYVAFGPHPEMPSGDEVLTASMIASGDLVTFDRGPGWVTNPRETKRIHDYWTKKGQPGYAKIGWGTRGDFTRAKKLIGEKIAANSPEDMKYLNQIIAQWHHDALGYWPGDLDMPGNKTTAEARAERKASAGNEHGIVAAEDIKADGWETVLVSSIAGGQKFPPLSYFHRQEDAGALVISEPDADGFRHTYGYAGEWGVCHIGMSGQCVEPPMSGSDDYPAFHLGRTKTEDGYVHTGVLTYGVGHRDAQTILRETPEQAYFDNINNAWAAVRVGEDERGIWFSGVVLPGVEFDHLVKIEASGQVSGEWLYGEMRSCLTVNVPGFAVQRASAEYDENGNVIALAASAFNNIDDAPCAQPTPAEIMAALRNADVSARMDALRAQFNWTDVAEELVAEAQDDGRVEPIGLREDGAVVYEKDGVVPGTDTITEPYPDGES